MYPLDSEGNIILNDMSFISVEDFEEKFGENYNFNYEYLSSHKNCTPAWKDIFDNWKENDILN